VTMSGAKVTFALIAFNQEDYVGQAVEGALAQTYQPLEIVLSDDCSTDRTFEIMKEMAVSYRGPHEILVRKNKKNLGLALHMNAVVECASSDIIAWAAGDDISRPCRICATVQPLLEDAHVMGVHSSVTEIDLNGKQGRVRDHPHLRDGFTLEDVVRKGYGVVSQTHIFRKSIFNKYGGFDAGLTNEGRVMAFRELLEGRIAYVRNSTVLYRVGSGVSTYSGMDVERRTILEPQKVAGWALSATSQMLSDLNYASIDNKPLEDELRARNRYWRRIYELNGSPFNFAAVFDLLRSGMFDRRAARAFVRRSSPFSVRALYSRLSVRRPVEFK
jgi:glycosyltransferase involved in cell wall biosynthesis